MWYGRLLIGKPALEVDVPSGFVHSAGTSIAMSRGLFKLHNLALQWQRDTTLASHGEEVSQIVRDTLLEAGIQFREPFFEGDPLFEHVRARGPRHGRVDGRERGRGGHRGRARGRALGRGAGGILIPPDIEAEAGVEGTSGTAHCDTEDIALYNTQDFIEGLLDDPIESQTTLSPFLSPDVTFIMSVDDMPQTPGRKSC
uniref:Uncharacterized protein n=1 Tax=Solanum tuberosum TaxID=4113 RepID=M1DRN3_SOLTU